MSDIVRPKKNRRRQRARKKKGAVTIDSIVPGRVPVGVLPTESEPTPYFAIDRSRISCPSERSDDSSALISNTQAHDINARSASSSDLPLQSSEADRITLLSPSQSRPSICAPIPNTSKTSFTLPFLQQPSASCQHASHLPQRPLSATALQSVKSPVPHHTSAGFVDAFSTCLSSPVAVSRAVSLDMAGGFVPSLSSQARAAELNAAAAARTRNTSRELNDFNNLMSSQPIPLSALSTRAHSRNKGSKSWRPLSLEDVEESSEEGKFLRGKQISDPSGARIIDLHRINAAKANTANPHLQNAMMPGRLDKRQQLSTANTMNAPQLRWVPDMDGGLQKNPLSQFIRFNSPFDASMSERNYHYAPPMSLPSGIGLVYSGKPRGREDRSPAKQEIKHSYRDVQENILCQNLLREDPSMPQSALPAYAPDTYAAASPSQLRPFYGSEPSPYNSHQQQGQTNIYHRRAATPDLLGESEVEFYTDLHPSPHVYDESNSHISVMATKPVFVDSVSQIQTPRSLSVRSSVSAQQSSGSKAKLPGREERQSLKTIEPYDTKKEMTAFLNSVVEASKSNTSRTVLHDPLAAIKAPAYTGRLRQELQPDNKPWLRPSHDRATCEPEKRLPTASTTSSDSGITTESFSLPSRDIVAATSREDRKGAPRDFLRQPSNKLENTQADVIAPETKPADGNTFKFPPPGLPLPVSHMGFAASAECFPLANSRLAESNAWFHTDGRGEERLRQKIRAIAREDVERRKKLRGYPAKDDLFAEQSTLLLGDVLANLQSYLQDSKEQTGNFANFGNVPQHCCEPSHGGRRSYFDRDPSVDQWRLPPGRAFIDLPYRAFEGGSDGRLSRSHIFQ